MTGRPLVLASASAIRAALLTRAGLDVVRDPAGIDEAAVKAVYPRDAGAAVECAAELAETKATYVSRRHGDALVIGADQILTCEKVWYDKPRDRAEARAQLEALSGKTHELVTAVAVMQKGAVLWHTVQRPRLTLRPLGAAFLDAYLAEAGDEVLSSVGAYQLEGRGVQLFHRIEGDFFAILGLPLLPLLDFLRGWGVLAR